MRALPLLHTLRALLALTLVGVVAGAAHAQTVLPFVLQDAASDTLVSVGSDGTLTPHLGLRFTDGTLQTTAASSAAGWGLSGNTGTVAGTHYLGTSDNTPFEIRVNGQRVMRFEPAVAPNVIGGYFGNMVNPGVIGATISGGGVSDLGNKVTSNYGTVGGGVNNSVSGQIALVGGGSSNVASGSTSTICGGRNNTASGDTSIVCGGNHNTASGTQSTIGGGVSNAATGTQSSVGGGQGNIAGGNFSTVPGGLDNTANGFGSFAAGSRAHAQHVSTFVWSDGSSDLVSPMSGTFNIRATNGVRVHHGFVQPTTWPMRIHNTNTTLVAGMRLTNEGFFDVTNHAPGSSGFARLNTSGNWTTVSDRRLKQDVIPATGLLDGVMQLQPARFRYQEDTSGAVHLGLIAQDVQAVFPEFVTEAEILTLDYAGLSTVALGAIREQQAVIEAQQRRIEALEASLARLETRLTGGL